MTCYFCEHRLTLLVFMLMCVYCEKVWLPLEYEQEVQQAIEAVKGAESG